MVYWLALWTLNPKTRVQISVEPLFHCHKNCSAVSSMFTFSQKCRTLVEELQQKHKQKIRFNRFLGSMVYWLAPWTLNPKTRVQISVEPLFHCHKNSCVVSSMFAFSRKSRTLVAESQAKHKHLIQQVRWCSV